MGRGRAKAKQTKLAREVKYRSSPADFDALRRELSGDSGTNRSSDDRYEDEEDDGYDNDRR
jgi:parvulin-like peptidyl-prolyl isomerase